MVGNKDDIDDKRAVTLEEAEAKAQKLKMKYMEVSAKTKHHISELFSQFSQDIIETKKNNNNTTIEPTQVNISMGNKENNASPSKGAAKKKEPEEPKKGCCSIF
mmetsp:Transcript_15571/g.13305  ORF Transcript_15571/g.13305 Transcript_15571/m.13305 type:complete len:104 (-) Transcript_15571:404-715(-)